MKHLLLLSALVLAALANTSCAIAADSSKPIRVSIVGGGSSHDFNRWFNEADTATIAATGKATAVYTDKPDSIAATLKDTDVLYLSNNQPFTNAATRAAIMDFSKQSAKGLLLIHPALWYNWRDWPEYNKELVTGGARSHDRFGEFEVTVTAPGHALMKGVPEKFKITDELYHFIPDGADSTREVLATGTSPTTGKTFPVAWITKGPQARVFCLTLGHDGKAHDHPAYKAILQNSVAWAAGK